MGKLSARATRAKTSLLLATGVSCLMMGASTLASEDAYAQRIAFTVRAHILWERQISSPRSYCQVQVDVDDTGRIQETEVQDSWGDPTWCPAVLKALAVTQRFPADDEGKMPAQTFILNFYSQPE